MTGRSRACVCDASAVIAFLRGEEGADAMREALEQADATLEPAALISTVNLSEVHQELGARLPGELIGPQGVIEPADFTIEHAREAAALRDETRSAGLGIADRACLALARVLELPALTADRAWGDLDLPVEVRLIR